MQTGDESSVQLPCSRAATPCAPWFLRLSAWPLISPHQSSDCPLRGHRCRQRKPVRWAWCAPVLRVAHVHGSALGGTADPPTHLRLSFLAAGGQRVGAASERSGRLAADGGLKLPPAHSCCRLSAPVTRHSRAMVSTAKSMRSLPRSRRVAGLHREQGMQPAGGGGEERQQRARHAAGVSAALDDGREQAGTVLRGPAAKMC